MSARDYKILGAAAALAIAIAIGKAKPTSTDEAIDVAKGELFPLGLNSLGLYMLLRFIK